MDTIAIKVIATEIPLNNGLEVKELDKSIHCPSEDSFECSESFFTVENSCDGEEFKDATEFFQNDQSLEYLENIRTSNQNSWLTRDSLGRNFDPLFKTYGQPLNLSTVVESETANLPASLPDVVVSVSPQSESLDVEEDSSNNIVDQKFCFVNGPILLPTRESIGNLMKFDSPVKKQPIDCFGSPNCADPTLYTEIELGKLLKLQELKVQEAYIRKLRDIELERAKILNEKDNKIHFFKGISSSLQLVLKNLIIIIQKLYQQKESLEETLTALQLLIQQKMENLKSASQNLDNAKDDFSNLQSSFDIAQELLGTYKIKESKLLAEAKTLQEKVLALEEDLKSTQSVSENVAETNAEDSNSTNDAPSAILQAKVEKLNLKEEYLKNRLQQAKEENRKLNNIVLNLKTKIEGL